MSASADPNFNLLMLADNVLAGSNASGEEGHRSLMAELNVLRLAASAYGLRSGETFIPDDKGQQLVMRKGGRL
jgi:hypothetical protein